MTRRHLARADAVAHTPAEDLTPCPGRCNAASQPSCWTGSAGGSRPGGAAA